MPHLSVDGSRLYYEEEGTGEPLLFVHGLGSSGRDWYEQAEFFSDRYRVFRIDLRGHGRSERTQGPYHVAQFARDVAVALRKLSDVPAHVVGLSMGGMVAFELAASAPRLVRSLVVTNSVADTRLHSCREVWFYVSRRLAVQILGLRRVGRLLARRLFVDSEQDELRREFIRRWSSNDKQAYLWSMDAIMGWSIQERLERITAPTLLISSDEDYTPVTAKERIAARMPNAELFVIDDARHAVPVERPEAYNALVDGFLKRLKQSTAEHPASRSGGSRWGRG